MQSMNSSADMDQCMKTCGECAGVCARTAHHCLGLGGEHASQEHQTLLQDCAEICGTSACFMARQSPHAAHLCRECAEICTLCAEACDRMARGDQKMISCADTCRRCAQACEKMAGVAGATR